MKTLKRFVVAAALVVVGVSASSLALAQDVPTPVLTAALADGTVVNDGDTAPSVSLVTFTVAWSERVTGFGTGEWTITNGTGGSFMAGIGADQGLRATFVVTPTADGVVTVQIPAAVATRPTGDRAENVASEVFTYTSGSTSTDPQTGDLTIEVTGTPGETETTWAFSGSIANVLSDTRINSDNFTRGAGIVTFTGPSGGNFLNASAANLTTERRDPPNVSGTATFQAGTVADPDSADSETVTHINLNNAAVGMRNGLGFWTSNTFTLRAGNAFTASGSVVVPYDIDNFVPDTYFRATNVLGTGGNIFLRAQAATVEVDTTPPVLATATPPATNAAGDEITVTFSEDVMVPNTINATAGGSGGANQVVGFFNAADAVYA